MTMSLFTQGIATKRSVLARLPKYTLCDSYRDLAGHRLGEVGYQYPNKSAVHHDLQFDGTPDITKRGQEVYRLQVQKFAEHPFMDVFFDKDTYAAIARSDPSASLFSVRAIVNEGQTDIAVTDLDKVFCENRIFGMVLLTLPDTLEAQTIDTERPSLSSSQIRDFGKRQQRAAIRHALDK